VNIRSIGETFTIFEKERDRPSEPWMESGPEECHPGAVYLHRARPYLVHHLDLEKKTSSPIRPSSITYAGLSEKETEIMEITRSRPKGQFIVREGRVKVTERITGYEKRALPGQELLGVHPLELPPQTFETVSFWIEIEDAIYSRIEAENLHFMEASTPWSMRPSASFLSLPFATATTSAASPTPTIPGREKRDLHLRRLSRRRRARSAGFEVVLELLQKTLEHLKACECEDGCPSASTLPSAARVTNLWTRKRRS